jgi:hypothetical protein
MRAGDLQIYNTTPSLINSILHSYHPSSFSWILVILSDAPLTSSTLSVKSGCVLTVSFIGGGTGENHRLVTSQLQNQCYGNSKMTNQDDTKFYIQV